MKEALYYELIGDDKTGCRLCPHNCNIAAGKAGICGVRKNTGSKLFTGIYGEVTSIAMDPIEKKPLYHFFPSSKILSIGTKGCNLKCPYCQNWHISQNMEARTRYYAPEEIARTAVNNGSMGVAYTYSEPVIWIEYVLDTAMSAASMGLKNVMVTNGFINAKPLEDLLGVIDAMNIDLKTFNPDTFRKVHKGELEPVKDAIAIASKKGCHVEVTTLVVTGVNDGMNELGEIIDFIASIDRNIPWHISRYYPNYKYESPATDTGLIMSVYHEAVKSLNYVYCGNIPLSSAGSSTLCPACKTILIERRGYTTKIKGLKDGACEKCGYRTGIRH